MNDTMNRMYDDFVQNVIPKIGEGITITKDYVMDFADRYIEYLIWHDTMMLWVCGILSAISLICFIGFILESIRYSKYKYWDMSNLALALLIITTVVLPFSVMGSITYINRLAKDKVVPEARLYEEYKLMTRTK